MELDLKKKIIIGISIIATLGILIYLYYDYASSKEENVDVSNFENNEIEIGQYEKNTTKEVEDTNEIIIIHITGAIKNPRYSKND